MHVFACVLSLVHYYLEHWQYRRSMCYTSLQKLQRYQGSFTLACLFLMWLLWQSWCVFMTWWIFYALLILITIDQFLKSIPHSLVTWNIPVRFFSMNFFLGNGSSRKSCSFGQSYSPFFGGTTSLHWNPLPASLHSWTPTILRAGFFFHNTICPLVRFRFQHYHVSVLHFHLVYYFFWLSILTDFHMCLLLGKSWNPMCIVCVTQIKASFRQWV